ncbi:DegV family protein [Mycolicibacillus trivialis]|uniref:Fatty acid-binding protein DegV n=1 Tax=Mycolicibacillus trivialis TaxID=1798 RepID=A0A1X2EPQ7_9MYCO|nr:DegV family protein [Mycolicibacillus trivialis]ORX07277.1 fatty acid-binding protein DegV [Mycolicibacillus trivialis]
MTVVVVTDSAARIPAPLRARWGIPEVPLHILADGADLSDGVDDMPADLMERGRVSTAAATPEELRAAYRRAHAASDGDGVVAVHVSAELSGTVGAAWAAAGEFGDAVRVVDSRSAAMGAGFVALAAARAAADGAELAVVAAAAATAAERGRAYLVVQRLESLRRSGRIGGAGAWLGTALSLKPLLRIDNGKLVLAQRIRTAGKAIAAMVERVCDTVGDQSAAIAVHHVDDPDGAAELAATLADRLPQCPPAIVTGLGPVLGLHVGPGALGVCVDPAAPQY